MTYPMWPDIIVALAFTFALGLFIGLTHKRHAAAERDSSKDTK